ncbi:MAG: metallophosphoesterase family protein [Candidatus Methylomirabilales bacterium]
MKILVLSDIHANFAALEAVVQAEGDFDRLIVLGDLVSYGPRPRECIEFVQRHAFVAVRGNHDHALAFNVDPRCSSVNKPLALATLRYHRTLLTDEAVEYLGKLPRSQKFHLDGYRFYAAHASPRDNLYSYRLTPELPDEALKKEISRVRADFLLLGHTHLPMVRGAGSRVVVNPGSVGQPRDGVPEASYAVIQDGVAEIKGVKYDLQKTVRALEVLPLEEAIIGRLITILETGR